MAMTKRWCREGERWSECIVVTLPVSIAAGVPPAYQVQARRLKLAEYAVMTMIGQFD